MSLPVDLSGLRPSLQGHALDIKSLTLGGSEDPWTTGARDEDSTIRGGRVV
jgi:hypothetical protein